MQKMFKLAKTVASRTFLKSPVPDDFVNDRSSIVLVGEAAHPLVVCVFLYPFIFGGESTTYVNHPVLA